MSVTLLPNLYAEALTHKAMASEDESSGRSSGSDGVTRAWPHAGIGALRRRGTRELALWLFPCVHTQRGGCPAASQEKSSTEPDHVDPDLTPSLGNCGKINFCRSSHPVFVTLLWQPEPRFFYCFSGSIL